MDHWPIKQAQKNPIIQKSYLLKTFTLYSKLIVDWENLYLYLQYKSDADPALYINPEQPLIAATNISQDDIEKQEARVVDTRKKLAQAIEALYGWMIAKMILHFLLKVSIF